MTVKQITGSGHDVDSIIRYRIVNHYRLWRCMTCGEQTMRHGDTMMDPKDDGSGFVEHPHQFEHAEKRLATAAKTSVSLGGPSHKVKGYRERGSEAVRRVCAAKGCEIRVRPGLSKRIGTFCMKHWMMLPQKTRRGLEHACPSDFRATMTAALRLMALKDAAENRP